MSTLVNLDPALGLTTSDTWDPPPPVEYGRSFNFPSGIDVGLNGTTGQASSGLYTVNVFDFFGDVPFIERYEVTYTPVDYTRYRTDYLGCQGNVLQPASDWFSGSIYSQQTASVTTSTVPQVITFEFASWNNNISYVDPPTADVVTPQDAIVVKADNVIIDVFQINKIDENSGSCAGAAGVGTQFISKQANLGTNLSIKLFDGANIVYDDYLTVSKVLLP
jgi:hypothetical protein